MVVLNDELEITFFQLHSCQFARMSDQNTAITPMLWISLWESGIEQLKESFSLLIPLYQVVDWILIEL